jgi:hypothetical protein
VLTERNEHLERLAGAIAPAVRHLVVLRGGMGKREVQAVADRLAKIHVDEERVLLATGRYAGEGFDDARLDTLFLTLPVSWRGQLPSMLAAFTASMTESVRSASMIMPILKCRCWRECSIGVVADMKPWATLLSFRRAQFRDGPRPFPCLRIRSGSVTIRQASGG